MKQNHFSSFARRMLPICLAASMTLCFASCSKFIRVERITREDNAEALSETTDKVEADRIVDKTALVETVEKYAWVLEPDEQIHADSLASADYNPFGMGEGADKRANYTSESLISLENAYLGVKRVAEIDNVTADEIDEAVNAVEKAYAELVRKPDKTLLHDLYREALSVSSEGNSPKYAPTSISQVTRLIDPAKTALADGDAREDTVKSLEKRLSYALDHLTANPIMPETLLDKYTFTVGLPDTVDASALPISNETLAALSRHLKTAGDAVGCIVYDLESGFTIGYNHNAAFFCASTVKAADVLYIYNKLIPEGKASLSDVNAYRPHHTTGGAGQMRFSLYGTKFTLEEASTMAVSISDNTAYYMLLDVYGIDGFNEYMKELGCTVAGKLTQNSKYGFSTAYDAALVWKEIYTYTRYGKHGILFRDNLINAVADVIDHAPQFEKVPVAHKSGWSDDYYNDIAIVYDTHPYVIAIYSLRDICSHNYLVNLAGMLSDAMTEYQDAVY